MVEDVSALYVGKKFASYDAVEIWLEKYQDRVGHEFSRQNSKTVANSRVKNLPDNLKYYEVQLGCVRRGIPKSKGTGIKKRKSKKTNCTAKIIIRAKNKKYLVVTDCDEKHNHESIRNGPVLAIIDTAEDKVRTRPREEDPRTEKEHPKTADSSDEEKNFTRGQNPFRLSSSSKNTMQRNSLAAESKRSAIPIDGDAVFPIGKVMRRDIVQVNLHKNTDDELPEKENLPQTDRFNGDHNSLPSKGLSPLGSSNRNTNLVQKSFLQDTSTTSAVPMTKDHSSPTAKVDSLQQALLRNNKLHHDTDQDDALNSQKITSNTLQAILHGDFYVTEKSPEPEDDHNLFFDNLSGLPEEPSVFDLDSLVFLTDTESTDTIVPKKLAPIRNGSQIDVGGGVLQSGTVGTSSRAQNEINSCIDVANNDSIQPSLVAEFGKSNIAIAVDQRKQDKNASNAMPAGAATTTLSTTATLGKAKDQVALQDISSPVKLPSEQTDGVVVVNTGGDKLPEKLEVQANDFPMQQIYPGSSDEEENLPLAKLSKPRERRPPKREARTINHRDTTAVEKKKSTDASEYLTSVAIKPTRGKGRPPKPRPRAIGLSQDAPSILRFSEKSNRRQTEIMLSWILPQEKSKLVLETDYKVKTADLNLKDDYVTEAFMSKSVKLDLLRPFLERNAFNALRKVINRKIENDIWTCGTCKAKLSGKTVLCESCLLWHDFVCVSLTKKPILKTPWFCPGCKK